MYKDLERKLKRLTKDEQKTFTKLLEKMDKEDKIFIPQYEETYWTIDEYDDVVLVEWTDSKLDETRLNKNIVFKTEQEALFEREKRRVKDELNMYARKNNDPEKEILDGQNLSYYIRFDIGKNLLYITEGYCYKTESTTYFTSRKTAVDAIMSVGEDRIKKYLFGIGE